MRTFLFMKKPPTLKAPSAIGSADEGVSCKKQIGQPVRKSCFRRGFEPEIRLADYFQAERQLKDWYRFQSQRPSNLQLTQRNYELF
jgi:hypothetical protein